jgi:DNA-binding NarL/FixJ family response regulator
MHKVFVIDDHEVIRQNYALLLKREPDMEMCGAAGSVEEALAKTAAADPDLIILDLSLGDGRGGLELLPVLCREMPNARVLVVSGHEAALYAERVSELGGHGYVPKGDVMAVLNKLRELAATLPDRSPGS